MPFNSIGSQPKYNAKNTRFEYRSKSDAIPSNSFGFPIHEVLFLSAENRLQIDRCIEKRCVAAPWYVFEEKGDCIDSTGGFGMCYSLATWLGIYFKS